MCNNMIMNQDNSLLLLFLLFIILVIILFIYCHSRFGDCEITSREIVCFIWYKKYQRMWFIPRTMSLTPRWLLSEKRITFSGIKYMYIKENEGWERNKSKCFFIYIHLGFFHTRIPWNFLWWKKINCTVIVTYQYVLSNQVWNRHMALLIWKFVQRKSLQIQQDRNEQITLTGPCDSRDARFLNVVLFSLIFE